MTDDISSTEARERLAQIEQTMAKARYYAAATASPALYTWGAVWMIAYGLCQYFPQRSGLIWAPAGMIGAALTVLFSMRAPVRSTTDKRFGLAWWILFIFAGVWLAVLMPWKQMAALDGMALQRSFGAYAATVVMFAYVIIGMWWDRFFMWLGLLVTALTLLGFFALPEYFNLWMAICGGGLLLVSGWLIKRRWKLH